MLKNKKRKKDCQCYKTNKYDNDFLDARPLTQCERTLMVQTSINQGNRNLLRFSCRWFKSHSKEQKFVAFFVVFVTSNFSEDLPQHKSNLNKPKKIMFHVFPVSHSLFIRVTLDDDMESVTEFLQSNPTLSTN